jgi:hypothetical protein
MQEQIENTFWKTRDLFLPYELRKFLGHYYIGNDKSTFYITNWSIVHFISGMILAFFLFFVYGKNVQRIFIMVFLLHTIWEAFQLYVHNTDNKTFRDKLDIVVDTCMSMLGAIAVVYTLPVYK